jgi:arylsulfatase A-like enzyme
MPGHTLAARHSTHPDDRRSKNALDLPVGVRFGWWRPRAGLLAGAGLVTLGVALATVPGADRSHEAQAVRPEAPTGAPLRIVVVVIDTLRADHLPFYGYERATAPFLTRLAQDAVVFEHCYSPASWTAPATASLFTSRYPQQHGVVLGLRATRKLHEQDQATPVRALPDDIETLPQAMRRAGYATFGLSQNINISSTLGFDRGFDRFRNFPADDDAGSLTAHLTAWQTRLAGAPRHFLYLHYLDPHSPYRERAPWHDPTTRGRARTLSAYDSEIRWVDEHLSAAYASSGWERDTLLVVTADHGEEFGEHGSVEHGRSLFGEVLDVPLIVRLPGGVRGGRRVATPVSLIDVLPTLREAVGLPRDERAAGRSLWPLLLHDDAAWPERPLFAHLWRPEPSAGHTLDQRAVLFDGHKLITGMGPLALYDTRLDPLDQQDRSAADPQAVARLQGLLTGFERALAARPDPVGARPALDDAQRARLRALGYVE